jgi:2-polyprenyl-6-hydroxyphenyl methylase/3-demethylubiquinone-9 3-methyltransferase
MKTQYQSFTQAITCNVDLTFIHAAEDREQLFKEIRANLAPHGKAILTSLAITPNYDPNDSFESVRLDEDFVLWRQTPGGDIPGVVEMNGKNWTAQKKLAPVEYLRAELALAGLRIVVDEFQVVPGQTIGNFKVVVTSA